MLIVDGPEVAKFVGDAVDRIIYPPFTAMGIEIDGEIVSGVVFNGFVRTDINVTVAGKVWPRAFLKAVGQYVFDRLGCIRITAITQQPQVVEFGLRLGGKIEGVLRDRFGPGRDGTLIGILKEEYRF